MAVDAEQIERDERERDRGVPVQHAFDDEWPVGRAGVVEGDQLAVEHKAGRHFAQFRHPVAHVPRPTTAYPEAVLGRDDRADSYFSSNAQPSPDGMPLGRSSIGRGRGRIPSRKLSRAGSQGINLALTAADRDAPHPYDSGGTGHDTDPPTTGPTRTRPRLCEVARVSEVVRPDQGRRSGGSR